MEYISVKEASERWGITLRTVQRYCIEDRIPGAVKHGNNWLIPRVSEKPPQLRKGTKPPRREHPAYVIYTATPWPKDNPDKVLQYLDEPVRSLAAANLASYRGDYLPAKECWHNLKDDPQGMLTAALLGSAAAVSSGDYELYHEIQGVLDECKAGTNNKRAKALISIPKTMVIVNMGISSMTPEWLKNGDFSMFDIELRPFLLYLYCLHLRNTGEGASARAVARTSIALIEKEETFTWMEIYFYLLCSGASYYMGEPQEARRYLKTALDMGLPFGLISFYAEWLTGYGGMVENMLFKEYPLLLESITELWDTTYRNWNNFRNQFTHENITTILTLQEHHAALLFARGMTYQQTADTLELSVRRVKGLISSTYEKLMITDREGLKDKLLIY